MDATNSHDNSLLTKLQNKFPQVTFRVGEDFHWAASEEVVYYNQDALQKVGGMYDLLHELGHALLGHHDYQYDVTLVQMEAEAWQKAVQLAVQFAISIDETYIDDAVDSYREWLDARSLCPRCHFTGIQKNKRTYQCINCRCAWRVNDAKFCGLKRYQLNSDTAATSY